MKRLWALICLCCWLSPATAVSPYVNADKVAAGELGAAVRQVEQKLAGVGFTVVGRHLPPGLPEYGVVVVTDPDMLTSLRAIGGKAVAAAAIRVGVKADGSVTYMNPEYWYRAYLRADYSKAAAAVTTVSERLRRSLGAAGGFGGDVAGDDLPQYRYMVGMERFDDDKSLLNTFPNYATAVKTIRENLARGTRQTSQVYEVAFQEAKLAVFGVAMNDSSDGEGWWVNKIGADHIAALPWEIFIVDNKAYALFGRYRTALAWPTLGMGNFMRIGSHPDSTRAMLTAVAGGRIESASPY